MTQGSRALSNGASCFQHQADRIGSPATGWPCSNSAGAGRTGPKPGWRAAHKAAFQSTQQAEPAQQAKAAAGRRCCCADLLQAGGSNKEADQLYRSWPKEPSHTSLDQPWLLALLSHERARPRLAPKPSSLSQENGFLIPRIPGWIRWRRPGDWPPLREARQCARLLGAITAADARDPAGPLAPGPLSSLRARSTSIAGIGWRL